MDIGSRIPVISGASYPDWIGMQEACSYCVCLENTCMCFLLTKLHLTHRIYLIIFLVTNEMKTAKLPHENKLQKQFITWHILIQNHHPYKRIIVTDISYHTLIKNSISDIFLLNALDSTQSHIWALCTLSNIETQVSERCDINLWPNNGYFPLPRPKHDPTICSRCPYQLYSLFIVSN